MGSKPDALQKALAQSCPGQHVRGTFLTESGARSVDHSLQLALSDRPQILPGRINPLFWLWDAWAVIAYLASGEPRWRTSAKLPRSAEIRKDFLSDSRHERAHFGDWNSIAGQMLTGFQGRARCIFDNCIVVTDQELLVVATSFNEKYAEITFRTPLTNIAWTRRPHRQKNRLQFGFIDGSWHTPSMVSYSKSQGFMDLFPNTLPHTAKIPDVLSSPPAEGIGS
ncbi:hypothetical protein ACH41E_11640 [Streptomyces sp. NPDC020412]|uniref:hypothetical protein n=1 Tax=Streptomyces sp. NPDC020412 TaxID=3365073 RepID=UPI00379B4510